MLAKYKGPPPGTECNEKYGWFYRGFDDLCREIINKQVRIVLRKQMNIPENCNYLFYYILLKKPHKCNKIMPLLP